MRNEKAMIALPELEEPLCCSKVQELAQALPDITIGYLHEEDLGQRMGTNHDQP